MNIEDIETVKDCLENTDEQGRENIRKLEQITPELAKVILEAYEHLSGTAFLDFLREKAKSS